MNLLVHSLLVSLFTFSALGQPWLSNRFAQNCAGCHAPGRQNKELAKRRCTLSCQGCHVNPNGGGIRSAYGSWNQQRWLKTFSTSFLAQDHAAPAPLNQQPYAKLAAKSPPRKEMKTLASAPGDESAYSREADTNWKTEAASTEEFERTIPAGDPYWKEQLNFVKAGGDLRYALVSTVSSSSRPTQTKGWLMGVDFGVQARPVPEHASLVLEARYLNGPSTNALSDGFTREARIRSAYALFDDLPFNSYFMYGLYRPMFGLYDANHYSIASTLTGLDQRAVFESVGIGSAPNVPFFNLNIIRPLSAPGYNNSRGVVANLGARFVTLGGSVTLSYWNTKREVASVDLTRQMIALNAGLTFERLTWNGEVVSVSQEFAPGLYDAGLVYTNMLLYRLWRETYATFTYANSNIALDMKEGSADEFSLGVKSFIVSGVELEALWSNRNMRNVTAAANEKSIQFHAHLFF